MSQSNVEDNSLPTIECGPDCPLRKPYTFKPDAVLAPAPHSPRLTRKEASARLYSPLEGSWTRLLLVDPGQLGSRLSAYLIAVDISNIAGAVTHSKGQVIQFAALSYTWGAASFSRSLWVNNIQYPITENLYTALQRWRSPTEALYIWVDAVCINQFDNEERAGQVNQMLSIYGKAYAVIVWLGEEGPRTKLAIDYLRWAEEETLTNRERDWARGAEWTNSTAKRVNEMLKPKRKGHTKECLRLASEVICGIEDICSRNWVRRIWVKQEVWAADEIIVRCGTSQLSWRSYAHGLNAVISPTAAEVENSPSPSCDLQSYHYRPNLPFNAVTCLRNLGPRPAHERKPEDLTSERLNMHEVLKLLNESIDCQTTDPHDRIYALVGMARSNKPAWEAKRTKSAFFSLEVDYSISLFEQYRRLAKSIMFYSGAYSILATDGVFNAHGDHDYASWVPDFRQAARCRLPEAFRFNSGTGFGPMQVKKEAQLRRFRRLNADFTDPNLYLEGICIAKFSESAPLQFESIWPIIDTSVPRDTPTVSKNYPDLVAMPVEAVGWIQREIEDGPKYSSPAIASYVKEYAAFAVSTKVRPGDIVVLVGTVGVPVVLRTIDHDQRLFTFVSCAWLVRDPSKIIQYEGFFGPQPLENKLALELMGGLSGAEEHKEVFRIE